MSSSAESRLSYAITDTVTDSCSQTSSGRPITARGGEKTKRCTWLVLPIVWYFIFTPVLVAKGCFMIYECIVHYKDCPLAVHLPLWLGIMGVLILIQATFQLSLIITACAQCIRGRMLRRKPIIRVCFAGFHLICIGWMIVGAVWTYTIAEQMKPWETWPWEYEKIDNTMCDSTVYTIAFWYLTILGTVYLVLVPVACIVMCCRACKAK